MLSRRGDTLDGRPLDTCRQRGLRCSPARLPRCAGLARLLGDHREDVPVLRAVDRLTVFVSLFELLNFEPLEQRLRLVRVTNVIVGSPAQLDPSCTTARVEATGWGRSR
jgi:hypothetical protein